MRMQIKILKRRSTLRSLLAEMQRMIDENKESIHLDKTIDIIKDDVSCAKENGTILSFVIEYLKN